MRMEIEDEVVVFDDADSAVYTDEVPEDAIIEDGVSSDSIDTGETLIVNLGGKVNDVLVNGESVVENKVARITLSKVGQTNDYNDLDNKPDVDAIKDDLNETKEQLDLVIKGQTSDSLAIVGLQSDMITAKSDIAGVKTQVEENTELLDQVNKGHAADSLAIVGLQSDVLTLKADVAKIDLSNTEIDAKVGELEADVSDLQDQIDDISTDNLVDLETNQEIGGVKTFKNQVGFKNEDGTIDYIKHINNNLLISTSTGENLLNIDEGLKKAYFFNKEVAFKSDIAGSGGTTVKVGGVAVAEFNADSKADASTVEQLGTEFGSLDAMVDSLGSDVSQQGTKVNALDAQLVSLATQVAMDYYNKTDTDGKFATKDQMASQDNTTLQSANSYTDTKIADLVDTAPETLDTLGEVAKAIKDNQDVVNALNSAIGNKVDKTVKINGHSLTQNIVLTAEDVGALSDIPDGYVTTDTLNSAMEKKVDKVDGKGLSTNDYTTADKEKLAGLSNYNDSALSNRITGVENNKANKGTLTNTDLQGSIQAGVYLVDLQTCTGLPNNIDDEEIYGGLGTLIASEQGRVLITTNGAEFFSKMYFMGYSENEGLFVNWEELPTTAMLDGKVDKETPTVVIGEGASFTPTTGYGVTIGHNATSDSVNVVAVGQTISNTGKGNVLIGTGNTIQGCGRSIAIGFNSSIYADSTNGDNIAIGGNLGDTNKAIQLGAGTNNTDNTLQIFNDNIYNHETHTLTVQEGHFTKIYIE